MLPALIAGLGAAALVAVALRVYERRKICREIDSIVDDELWGAAVVRDKDAMHRRERCLMRSGVIGRRDAVFGEIAGSASGFDFEAFAVYEAYMSEPSLIVLVDGLDACPFSMNACHGRRLAGVSMGNIVLERLVSAYTSDRRGFLAFMNAGRQEAALAAWHVKAWDEMSCNGRTLFVRAPWNGLSFEKPYVVKPVCRYINAFLRFCGNRATMSLAD